MGSFVRILSLLWADILVSFALFVMQNYLTKVWNLSFTHAAGILNIWNGIVMLLPLVFLFLRDSWLGNFKVLVISSIAYSLGIGFVTMSVPSVLANPCKQVEAKCIGRAQKALFYTGMLLIAIGIGCNRVSLVSFAKQNQNHVNGKQLQPICLQILGFIWVIIIVPIVGAIALPYIKPWELRFGIPAICTAFATILFLTGLCCWKYNFDDLEGNKTVIPEGNPITNICRVFVASVYKSCLRRRDDSQFHIGEHEAQSFTETRFLGCLEKAALKQDDRVYKWTLCSIAEVEQVKTVFRMVPLWLTFIICGAVSSTGNTFFVAQADHLDRHIGKWNVPLPALRIFHGWAKNVIGDIAARMLKKKRRHMKGFALAMLFSILCCITAAKTELKRLYVVRKHNLIDKPDLDIPMGIYWLLFQFLLMAGLNAFIEKSVVAFYCDQVSSPGAMKYYLLYLTKGVYGLGFMLEVLLVYVVGKISGIRGHRNWFQFRLNESRLDRYYWVLAVLCSVNLIVYVVVFCCYRSKSSIAEGGAPPDLEPGGQEMGDAEEMQQFIMAEI